MPSWSSLSGTGNSQQAALDALATALGVSAGNYETPICSKNALGVWTCSVLVFDPTP
jgi:hypothetical protein